MTSRGYNQQNSEVSTLQNKPSFFFNKQNKMTLGIHKEKEIWEISETNAVSRPCINPG